MCNTGVTAGGCRNNFDTFHINPQIQLFLPETDELVICVNQHLLLEAKVIGFSIYNSPTKLSNNNTEHRLDKAFFKKNKSLLSSAYTNSKYVVLRSLLETGTYVLMPTTYETGMALSVKIILIDDAIEQVKRVSSLFVCTHQSKSN